MKRHLALAATVMLLPAVAACSSDNDTKKPQPSPSVTTITEKPSSSEPDPLDNYTPPGADAPEGKSGNPRGAWPSVKGDDATSVAVAHQTAAYAVDGKLDRSYSDSIRRAAKLETPALSKKSLSEHPGTDTTLNDLMQAKAYQEAKCKYTPIEGQAKATKTTSQLVISCKLTIHGGPQDKTTENRMDVVNLTRSGSNPWRVDSTQPIPTN